MMLGGRDSGRDLGRGDAGELPGSCRWAERGRRRPCEGTDQDSAIW